MAILVTDDDNLMCFVEAKHRNFQAKRVIFHLQFVTSSNKLLMDDVFQYNDIYLRIFCLTSNCEQCCRTSVLL